MLGIILDIASIVLSIVTIIIIIGLNRKGDSNAND